MIGHETTFSVLKTIFPQLSNERLVALLSGNARNIFQMPDASIQNNRPASITLFDPAGKVQVNRAFFKSKSANSAFIGMELNGRVAGIVAGNQVTTLN